MYCYPTSLKLFKSQESRISSVKVCVGDATMIKYYHIIKIEKYQSRQREKHL